MSDRQGLIVVGAKPLARFIFGDENKFRTIYQPEVREQLGLFDMCGHVCGRPETIVERIKQREAAGSSAE
jgi:hypothetical protein